MNPCKTGVAARSPPHAPGGKVLPMVHHHGHIDAAQDASDRSSGCGGHAPVVVILASSTRLPEAWRGARGSVLCGQ